MKETIREMAYLIKFPIESWLEDTEAISPATTYYAELLSCINDSAEVLYNAGYRKISENAVVLSRKEYEKLKVLANNKCQYHCSLLDLTDFKSEKELRDYTRKETAMVFAEKLENGIDNLDIILHEDNDEQYVSINQLFEFIDEIAKQFGVEMKEQDNERI